VLTDWLLTGPEGVDMRGVYVMAVEGVQKTDHAVGIGAM
jgi:hypothetical protein